MLHLLQDLDLARHGRRELAIPLKEQLFDGHLVVVHLVEATEDAAVCRGHGMEGREWNAGEEGRVSKPRGTIRQRCHRRNIPTLPNTYPYVPSPIVSVRLKLLIVRVPHGAVEEEEEACDDETTPKAFPPSSGRPQLPPTGPPAMALCRLRALCSTRGL